MLKLSVKHSSQTPSVYSLYLNIAYSREVRKQECVLGFLFSERAPISNPRRYRRKWDSFFTHAYRIRKDMGAIRSTLQHEAILFNILYCLVWAAKRLIRSRVMVPGFPEPMVWLSIETTGTMSLNDPVMNTSSALCISSSGIGRSVVG